MPNLKLKSVPTSPVRGGFAGNQKRQQSRYQPYSTNWKHGQEASQTSGSSAKTCQLGCPLGGAVELEVEAEEVSPDAAPTLLRKQHSSNDNYCIVNPVPVAWSVDSVLKVQRQDFSVTVQPPVLCPVVSPVRSVLNVRKLSQKKDISPSSKSKREINSVKGVSIVGHCVFAQIVPSALKVAHVKPVGGRLQNFWQVWSLLGANPRVVSILKDGYILPFKIRPPLVRDPLIISGYANPLRNIYLKEVLHALIHKKAVERVRVRTSLAFFNRLFIVPKPNQKWRPILDLSTLNKFLCVKTFKMETPETIPISLQQGEWVTSPISTYQYTPGPESSSGFTFKTSLTNFRPFLLASTTPMEFIWVVKEVKLMAQSRGIRIHQYLDDWLVRAPTKESCHQDTQSLLALCQELGWIVNLQKSELEPKQVFDFVGYQYDLLHRLVKLTQNRYESNLQKFDRLAESGSSCP